MEQGIDDCLEYDILENPKILTALAFMAENIEKGADYAKSYKKAAHEPNPTSAPLRTPARCKIYAPLAEYDKKLTPLTRG
ncbi:MAG: hypothetical protein ACK5LE_06200 [Alphaproteobacteria bacterium]